MNSTKLLSLLKRCRVQNLRDRGSDFQASCPYHDERNPSWGISKREPHLFGCFACNAKGSIVTLLMDKLGMSRTAADQLAEVNSVTPRARDIFLEEESWALAPKSSMDDVFDTFVPSREAYRYLMKRGITLKTATAARVRYDFDLKRVLFPWYIRGRLVGFTGRSTDPTEKVKTLPYNETKKGEYLYVPDPNFRPKDSKLVLVEGEIDSQKIWQNCNASVAAVGFGTFTPEQQALVVSWSPSEVVCFFDDDDTGYKLYNSVRKNIGRKVRVSRVDYRPYRDLPEYDLEDKLDPGCLTPEHTRAMLSKIRSDLSL